MPVVSIKIRKGVLTPKMKSEIHEQLVQVIINTVGGGNKDIAQYVTTIIEEQEPENFSTGGKVASLE